MNTAELAEKIATEHNLGKAEAKRMVETVLSTIVHTASQGEEVSLSSFGKFKVAERPVRQGRNPATGETIEIAASRKLAFMPAKQIRDTLNRADEAPAPATTARRKSTSSAGARA